MRLLLPARPEVWLLVLISAAAAGSSLAAPPCPFGVTERARLDFDDPLEWRRANVTACGPSGCSFEPKGVAAPGRGARVAALPGRGGWRYLRTPAADLLNLDHGGIALWYLGAATLSPLLDIPGSDGWRILLTPRGGGRHVSALLRNGPAGGIELTGEFANPSSGWHHVALVWDLEVVRLYLDGALAAERPRNQHFPRSEGMPRWAYLAGAPDASRVGASIDGVRSFDGAPDRAFIAALRASPPEPSIRYALDFEDRRESVRRALCHDSGDGAGCVDPGWNHRVEGVAGLGLSPGGGYLALPLHRALHPDASGSLAFWLRLDGPLDPGKAMRLVDSDDDLGRRFFLGSVPGRGDVLRFEVTDASGNQGVATAPMSMLRDQAWHHVAATWGGQAGQLRLYMDGRPAGPAASVPGNLGGPLADRSRLYLIGSGRAGDPFEANGPQANRVSIDAFRTWWGALDESAVAGLAAAPPEPTPRFVLDFDGEAIDERDGSCPNCVTAEGRRGKGVKVDGTDPHGILTLPAADVLNVERGTLTAWVGSDAWAAGSQRLFHSKHLGDFRTLWIQLESPGTVRAVAHFSQAAGGSDGIAMIAPAHSWGPGEWRHLGFGWEPTSSGGTRLRLWLDGILVKEVESQTDYLGDTIGAELWALGSRRGGTWNMSTDGRLRMDGLETFNELLSAEELTSVYRRGLRERGLVRQVDDRLELALAGSEDGFGLAALADRADCSVKTLAAPAGELWRLRLENPDDPSQAIYVTNRATLRSQVVHESTATGEHLRWTGIELPAPDPSMTFSTQPGSSADTLDVEVEIRPRGGETAFEIELGVANRSGWTLADVQLPLRRLAPADPADLGRTSLVVPTGVIGARVAEPFSGGINGDPTFYTYPSGMMSMQWFAVDHQGTSDLYVATEDPQARIKRFRFCNYSSVPCYGGDATDTNGVGVTLSILPRRVGHAGNHFNFCDQPDPASCFCPDGDESDCGLDMQWPLVLALEGGPHAEADWFDHAKRYKEFVDTETPWTERTIFERMASSAPDHPSWMAEAGYISAHRLLDVLGYLNVRFGGDGALIWHKTGWGPSQQPGLCGCSVERQDNNFPYPATGSRVAADAAFAQSRGIPIAPYFLASDLDVLSQRSDGAGGCTVAKPWKEISGWTEDDPLFLPIRHRNGSLEINGPSAQCPPTCCAAGGKPLSRRYYACPGEKRWQDVFGERLLDSQFRSCQPCDDVCLVGNGTAAACADLQSDPAHCGTCGQSCGADEVCSGGTCKQACAPGLIACEGRCIDPQSDRLFCGADSSCQDATRCALDEVCSAGACEPGECPYLPIGGLYVDVVATKNPILCYNQDGAGYQPGGGTYWVEGHKRILDNLRAALESHNSTGDAMGFYSENFSEPYVGNLNGFGLFKFPYEARPLPLAQAVYHPNAQFLGAYTHGSIESDPVPGQSCSSATLGFQATVAKQGLNLTWGGMPGFILTLPSFTCGRSGYVDYPVKLAHAHRLFRDYLVHGEMERAPQATLAAGGPIPELTTTVLRELPVAPTLDLRHPAVAVSAWTPSFDDSRRGVVVASLDTTASYAVRLPVAPDRTVWKLEATGTDCPGRASDCVPVGSPAQGCICRVAQRVRGTGRTVEIDVEPLDVFVIEEER